VIEDIDLGTGKAIMNVSFDDALYYSILSELGGFEIADEKELISLLKELSSMKSRYDRVADALAMAEEKGYGIVMPTLGELKLDEPSLVKQPNGYGVKVSAHADSIHMIKTGIKADLCPVIGSEEQSEEVVKFLQSEFEENPDKVWEYNMFGRSLYEMVSDGMNAKLSHMPDESREKLGETLGKIINEGSNGLICILL
jgi:stage IV sporulation protein A